MSIKSACRVLTLAPTNISVALYYLRRIYFNCMFLFFFNLTFVLFNLKTILFQS